MSKLKPCPFCGSSKVEFWRIHEHGGLDGYVQCRDCWSQGPQEDAPKQAEELWQKRANQPTYGAYRFLFWATVAAVAYSNTEAGEFESLLAASVLCVQAIYAAYAWRKEYQLRRRK